MAKKVDKMLGITHHQENVNTTKMRYPLTQDTKMKASNVCGTMGEKEPSSTGG